ncbi:hypothetical protein Hypma_002596 [Hypsizygus marmoreus]|uniref:Uncharacterized protein n=1 Tax=Hypsizygus marmoreus TaxID=39966 RepID=A0A369J409_HYPMA|nr:hypothetical protein Hypma_002596 [Hypsizygus marmoreus]
MAYHIEPDTLDKKPRTMTSVNGFPPPAWTPSATAEDAEDQPILPAGQALGKYKPQSTLVEKAIYILLFPFVWLWSSAIATTGGIQQGLIALRRLLRQLLQVVAVVWIIASVIRQTPVLTNGDIVAVCELNKMMSNSGPCEFVRNGWSTRNEPRKTTLVDFLGTRPINKLTNDSVTGGHITVISAVARPILRTMAMARSLNTTVISSAIQNRTALSSALSTIRQAADEAGTSLQNYNALAVSVTNTANIFDSVQVTSSRSPGVLAELLARTRGIKTNKKNDTLTFITASRFLEIMLPQLVVLVKTSLAGLDVLEQELQVASDIMNMEQSRTIESESAWSLGSVRATATSANHANQQVARQGKEFVSEVSGYIDHARFIVKEQEAQLVILGQKLSAAHLTELPVNVQILASVD